MVFPIERMNPTARKRLLKEFFEQVIYPQRMNLLAFRELDNQTAMVDTDGHLGQLITSIITGKPGTGKKGKSGDELGDLLDGSEVKSGWRIDQKNDDEKEDAHPHFGNLAYKRAPTGGAKRVSDFLACKKLYVVYHSYTISGHYKCELIQVDLTDPKVENTIKKWLGTTSKKDLQPRLYPDKVRDRLATSSRSYKKLGAKLVARIIQSESNEGIIDIWKPNAPVSLDECIKYKRKTLQAIGENFASHEPLAAELFGSTEGARSFFEKCVVRYRNKLQRFCVLTHTTANLGYGFLAQHLVSMLIGVKGEDSKSNGDDLEGGGEIKSAFGYKWDGSGALDVPRWDLSGSKKADMRGDSETPWSRFIGVRYWLQNNQLAVRILEPEIRHFREEVAKYWDKYPQSKMLNIHMRGEFSETTKFSHAMEDKRCMEIECELLLHLEESSGTVIVQP